MNKHALVLLINLILLFNPYRIYAADNDHVRRIEISEGQTVTQEIVIAPGFAVMIEVPTELVSFSIADQTSFTCDKVPPDLNKILCKPLTSSPFTTNLIASTAKNEFNIILRADINGDAHPFKYVFYDHADDKISALSQELPTTIEAVSGNNLMDHLLDDYRHEKCSDRSSNQYAEIRCLEKIRIGTESYLRFQITSRARVSFNIVNVSAVIQTLGGFTGLNLKSESPAMTNYVIKTKNLRFGENVIGIVKIPDVAVSESQRAVLTIYTDLGKEADLILKDILTHV